MDVPSKNLARAMDLCGCISGRNRDKVARSGRTPSAAVRVSSPGIEGFPVNTECAIRTSVDLGSHTYYFGQIMAVRCDPSVLDASGAICVETLAPLTAFGAASPRH